MQTPLSDNFYCLPAADVLRGLSVTKEGLTGSEAEKRLKTYGLNLLKEGHASSLVRLFFSQFRSPVTILLIVAAFLSLGLKDTTDAVIILFIILVSSLLSFWQEKGATKAVNELVKLVQIRCQAVRDGKETALPVEEVVPGDIVLLKAGGIVPGDGLVLESADLFTDEGAFTGETFPVEKYPGTISVDEPLSRRSNVLFMGSHVISGQGKALIVKTGKDTELGKISAQLRSRIPETGFEKGIQRLGYMLMEITLILVVIIFGINVLLYRPPLDSILFSLALAVGLTPQLLPAIISINLSAGAREMAKNSVIVKRLSAIENLGSMDLLCTDKTGTITAGKVTWKDALDVEGQYSEKTKLYAWLNAHLQTGYVNPIDQAIQVSGQMVAEGYTVLAEIAYDFLRRRLSVQVRHGAENIVITKGAFNAVMDICSSVELPNGQVIPIAERQAVIKDQYESLSNAGYRVLGVAWKKGSDLKDFTRYDEMEMIFLGFIVLFDPLKEDVQETIGKLQQLGVQLKIITGDNQLVAASLAKQLGIEHPVILTGSQINKMSNSAFLYQVRQADIFAEVEPNQKEKIVLFLKKSGNVVGFLGDGINDAPALHAADVGISVDSAADVAKEAADIVLLNHSLDVLIRGITSGRKTFTNTLKYIFMATSANFGNMFSMAGASLLLPFLPLLPKQILLTNLLTDFPEMTIARDRVDDVAISRPHKWDIVFLRRFMIVFGLLSSAFDYLTFGTLIFILKADVAVFRTGWFVESVVSATLIVLVMRTRLPFFQSPPGRGMLIATVGVLAFVLILPWLPFAGLLGLAPLPLSCFGWIGGIVVLYVLSAEMLKRWFFRKQD